MKVKFNFGIKTYSGTVDEFTYGAYRQGNICIGRKFVMPVLTEQNTTIGNIMKNLSTVYKEADPDYKGNLKTYSVLNGRENVPKTMLAPTAYAIFVKMMFAWQKENSATVDLAVVTIEDIVSQPAPVINVYGAIEAGYLHDVSGSESLVDDIG
ncbi:MAG: hypothetical protein CVU48_04515 [Candidatus Cloacimonetes bacterium HGW-Cloacimonetes-1]|jgi:hypothetical protein|nr:MAG: hypothetical protein CVU48_04515 [Candidatus Cloacimonetes bacterium HGW-Cloacimonetes-1]